MKQVIVLEQTAGSSGEIQVRYALWATVPGARQPFYADANATSAFKNVSAAELTAIQQGAVAEFIGTASWPSGTTFAQAQAFLQAAWNRWQNQVNSSNPWAHYGTSWDGTTWTVGGVA